MAEENRDSLKTELASALAHGVPEMASARARDLPRPTVYRWASEREVRKKVDAYRRRLIDRSRQGGGRRAEDGAVAEPAEPGIGIEGDQHEGVPLMLAEEGEGANLQNELSS